MDNSGAVIEARELRKNFGSVQAVKSVSFAVRKGEIFGLFGPNGAGKTTTIRLLCGLTKPAFGSGTVYGHYIMYDPTGVRRHLTITPEESIFYEKMTAGAYLKFFASMAGHAKQSAKTRIQMVVDICELSGLMNKRIATLSHGQRQKISLARTFLSNVPIMFLDEPFQGIDIIHRKSLREYLREYVKNGNTVFFTSHNLIEAEHIVDRFAFIDQGTILKIGSARELRDQYLLPRYSLRVSDPVKAQKVLSDGLSLDECIAKGDEVVITLRNREDVPRVSALLGTAGIALMEMRLLGTMEEVFLRIRQKPEVGA